MWRDSADKYSNLQRQLGTGGFMEFSKVAGWLANPRCTAVEIRAFALKQSE